MKTITVFLSVLLLTACGMKPSDELIAQQVTGQILNQHSGVIFDVINFKKVNGISRDNSHYDAEVEYDLRFTVDLEDAVARLQQGNGSILAAGMEATALGLHYGNFKKGDTIHKKEWFPFVRSEQGWMIDTKMK